MVMMNADGNVLMNPNGDVALDSSCCCEEGCCPGVPANLTATVTISCECVTGVSVPLAYDGIEGAYRVWRGSAATSCTGVGGSTFEVRMLMGVVESETCKPEIAFTCGDADGEVVTTQGAEDDWTCSPFFAAGSAYNDNIAGAPFQCCGSTGEGTFIEWSITE